MQEINLADLLRPINEANAVGTDLRLNTSSQSLYYRIRDARQEARAMEKRCLMGESVNNGFSFWHPVYTLAMDALSHHSKDLEISAWFIEASLRLYQYEGLANGFKLLSLMVERFWEQLFPMPEDGDLELKLAAFSGLNGDDSPGSLIQPMKSISITEGKSTGPFVFWQYQQAMGSEKIGDKTRQDQRIRELGFSFADIQIAGKETSPGFFKKLISDLGASLDSFSDLDRQFMEKCGQHAPPTSRIKNTLQEILDHVYFLVGETPCRAGLQRELTDGTENGAMQFGEEMREGASSSLRNAVSDRAEALDLLHRAANYFSAAEPHSPIPFLLQRAIRWSRMGLPELMLELVPDSGARNTISRLTGIVLDN